MRTAGETGRGGEKYAEAYLKRAGYHIIERNFRTRQGEIDLIASSRDGFLVFLEVKTRESDKFATACEFVTPAKQRRIITAAAIWLETHSVNAQPRFDVMEVYWPKEAKKPTDIRHIPNAFEC